MDPTSDADIRAALEIEHSKLLKRLAKWSSATSMYRWTNVVLFMCCKLVVPTGALIVAINMISIVMHKPLLADTISAAIAITVTFLASLEAMLNPGAKKRLAFTLNNELCSIAHKLSLVKISGSNEKLQRAIVWAEGETKRLLNHYSENGY